MSKSMGSPTLWLGCPIGSLSRIPDRGKIMKATYNHAMYNILIDGRHTVTGDPKRFYHLVLVCVSTCMNSHKITYV